MNRPTGVRPINLQLFAEETIPAKQEEANLDNKPEVKAEEGFSIRRAFGLPDKAATKEPEKQEDKKPDVKPDVKPADKTDVKEPVKAVDTKLPEKEPDQEDEEIVYLGKTIKVKDLPKEERKTYLQKGMNYDKVKETAETANAALLRVAKLEGFSTVKEYLAELDKRESAKLAEAVEAAEGDPEKINEIINDRIVNHPKVIETQERERKQALRDAKTELGKDEFFKELEPEFDRLMEQNPTAEPELVYSIIVGKYVRSDAYKQKKSAEKELSEKEKEAIKESAIKATIADVHDKERRTAPKGGDANDGTEVAVATSFGSKLSEAFGLDKNHAQRAAQRAHEKLKNGR